MAKKVFVGNLSYSVGDAELREGFGAYGEVVSANIVLDRETQRPRGFGFVEFTTDEAAKASVDGLSGRDFHGRPVTVREAEDRRRGPGGPPGGPVGGGSSGGGPRPARPPGAGSGGGYRGGSNSGGGGYRGGDSAGGGGYRGGDNAGGGGYRGGDSAGGGGYRGGDSAGGGGYRGSGSSGGGGNSGGGYDRPPRSFAPPAPPPEEDFDGEEVRRRKPKKKPAAERDWDSEGGDKPRQKARYQDYMDYDDD